ncbi:MAG: AsnC family transcriptional regulator [Salibacteraceae bacterium]|mgnify:CR=1 FL=1|jgi:Lrp/AsnC family transcriptional regulator, regulator for asnA, asnC and gidA|nr:AsnC family transcriptional regulator [Salibacteraceae bacterium]MDP4844139.1 AsnC family transcriptional regulator [Salibacteraceae bacterium]MDP4964675.1 AsnC family transcriptional regulator [Salibacteraceae bacterium]
MNYEIDKTDRQILTLLIKDARMPFTEIAKQLNVSPGTVHGRVKKMEKKRIITGATLSVNYEVVGYGLTAYIGLIVGRTIDSNSIINELIKVPEVTVANIATGQFSIFCKIRCRDAKHAKDIIFKMNAISGVLRTETMICLEESINDKERLFRSIFNITD